MHLKQRRRITPALMLVLMLVLFAACGQQTPDQAASTGQPSTQAGGEITGTVEIYAFEMEFRPAEITVDKPGRYTLTLVNDGMIVHDVTLADGTRVVANPGETRSIEVDVPSAGIDFTCSVPGHEAAGMQGRINIAQAAGAER